MDYAFIKDSLQVYEATKVDIFCSYLKQIETERNKDKSLKNTWFTYLSKQQAVELYKKVAMDNLFIDGTTITLSYRGNIIITYNFQAYKNKLLNIYPESLFDIQLVKEGDFFEFGKVNGRVEYKHKIGDPFKLDCKIIGVYCIIKNNRGEFLETLDMNEVEKMKKVAIIKNIWAEWEGEMILKSVIKRACKRHFNDLVVNIESLDNENYNIDNVSIDFDYQVKVGEAKTEQELVSIYRLASDEQKRNPEFIRILQERKEEIMLDTPPKIGISDKDFPNALSQLKRGKIDSDYLSEKYLLTNDQLKQIEKCLE